MILVGAVATALGAAAMTPASAQIVRSPEAIGIKTLPDLKTDVGWRGRRHWRRHHGHWRHRHWRHRHGWYGPGPGAVAGLAAGAIIGGAIAAQNSARGDSAAIQYCIDRFKSYDIRTQTYLGYDGLRHSCP